MVGSRNIAEHFATIYSELYSKVDLDENFENLSDEINSRVDQMSMGDVDRINDNLVREALKKMKAGKSDSLFDFGSDCIVNGTDSLIQGHCYCQPATQGLRFNSIKHEPLHKTNGLILLPANLLGAVALLTLGVQEVQGVP